ncbi:hypothetical protein D3C74_325170 [compost metagenome]
MGLRQFRPQLVAERFKSVKVNDETGPLDIDVDFRKILRYLEKSGRQVVGRYEIIDLPTRQPPAFQYVPYRVDTNDFYRV